MPGVHHILRFIEQEITVQGISKREVARRAGIHHDSLYRYLQGRDKCALEQAEAILNVLGYTVKITPHKEPKK
jgi:DNA-binding phage protein